MRLAERDLGALEVAHEAPDVADRVQPLGSRRGDVEPAQLARRAYQLLLRALPFAGHRGYLGAMDPADAGETIEVVP